MDEDTHAKPLTGTLTVKDENGNPLLHVQDMRLDLYARLYRGIAKMEDAHDQLGVLLFGLFVGTKLVCEVEPTQQIRLMFERLVLSIRARGRSEEWENLDHDPVLSCCYHMLADGFITRGDAFVLAQTLKITKTDDNPEAFRKRFDRWVASHKLKAIKSPKRKKRGEA